MKSHTPSQVLAGETERLRHHSFTRWMSRDLLQVATDFLRNIGMVPIYAEHATDGTGRYLLWSPPPDAYFEVRSGRTEEQFQQFDAANVQRGWPLLSLHVNRSGLHSAVWTSQAHEETAVAVLAAYGITRARRNAADS